MKTLPVVETTRATIGLLDATDRVFSPRIVAERVAEKLHLSTEEILERVFYYLRSLISLEALRFSKVTKTLSYDSAIWIAPDKVFQFSPEFPEWTNGVAAHAKRLNLNLELE